MATDVTCCTRKGRGRPKIFDRDAMLDKAMMLFWQQGYEATSLADLVEATGAKAPTLYAEFNNKEGLFRAALDRYMARFSAKHRAALFCEEKTVEQALCDYLHALANCFAGSDTPAGCFLINTSVTVSASSEPIADSIRERQTAQEQTLLAFLLQRQLRGEIPSPTDVQTTALFLSCIIHGMSVSAREGVSLDKLQQIIDTTLRLWPVLIKLNERSAD
ncbi:TetR/AcrR family transcriptional regulator [Enterobacter sp. R4-368]|uniref:TetR/AcrR family transcriptional regulator n=1 Tax=Enterobacter sp. R4-368 TaxID=1166130 RepID=UPI0005C98D64|nr:TetR/AcrR family transcriptional regulator [Enterobacter sp. R4-368]